MKKRAPVAVAALVLVAVAISRVDLLRGTASTKSGAAAIVELFESQRSGVWVEAEGEIVHILPNDDKPPRHQNFLIEIAPNRTVKLSHNVDIAPRVPIRKGDRIRFRGRYEYNARGGVVHWTHRDPSDRKNGGHLEYEGKTYR